MNAAANQATEKAPAIGGQRGTQLRWCSADDLAGRDACIVWEPNGAAGRPNPRRWK